MSLISCSCAGASPSHFGYWSSRNMTGMCSFRGIIGAFAGRVMTAQNQ